MVMKKLCLFFCAILAVFALTMSPLGVGVQAKVDDIIRDCVEQELKGKRDGLACMRRLTEPCRKRPDMQAPSEQLECIEREFVLWDRILNQEYRLVIKALETHKKRKIKFVEAQRLWSKFHHSDCRLPYHVYETEMKASTAGLYCSLKKTARRAIEMRLWRNKLVAK